MAAVMRRACIASHQYKTQLAAMTSMPLRNDRTSIHTSHWSSQSSNKDPPPGSMKVMYIPNPFKWLHNRLEIGNLKREFDPNFNEEEFKFGAKQAVCTITDIVNKREWGELRGLLTQGAIDKLRQTKWTLDQTNNIVLEPKNVQVVQISNINLQVIVDQKYCDIDLTVIGARVPYNLEKHSIIMLEYLVRFHRDYSEGKLPEWTVTMFKLQNFQAVPRR